MKTRLTSSTRVAASVLQRGEAVAFPTETVYGLGASAFDEEAIAKIFRAKGRPADNPLIAHIAALDQLPLLAARVTPHAARLIAAFFPGPLTVILPRHPAVPKIATAGLDTIGVRMPAHPVAREFLAACVVPVVAPSANRSGRPSPTTWRAVRDDLDGRIACILRGAATDVGLESTVVDCTGRSPLVLRSGAVTLEALRAVVPSTRLHRPRKGERARSPGMKHRHYAPQARVVLLDSSAPKRTKGTKAGDASAAFIGLRAPSEVKSFSRVCLCRDAAQYAQRVFQFFRECDAAGIKTIFCESVPARGIGLALMDRLHRAAAR